MLNLRKFAQALPSLTVPMEANFIPRFPPPLDPISDTTFFVLLREIRQGYSSLLLELFSSQGISNREYNNMRNQLAFTLPRKLTWLADNFTGRELRAIC